MIIKFKILNNVVSIPTRAKKGDAGMDVRSAQAGTISAGSYLDFKTGIAMQLPEGYYGQFASRSGLAIKHNVTAFSGVIDNGYRGEMIVRLRNHGHKDFRVEVGDRIAQLIILPYLEANGVEVMELDDTDRGSDGFGSTGI
jgi:dUTP pyrophosphatase